MSQFKLDFLQLEVTAQCNLRCVHCYTDSDVHSKHRNVLGIDDYKRAASDAIKLGASRVQIIGGEPGLWPHTSDLLYFLKEIGFHSIEYYSNLTIVPPKVEAALKAVQADIAFALISHDERVHDSITDNQGSWAATVRNVEKLVPTNRVRAAVTEFPQNRNSIEQTKAFLHSLGVSTVGIDRVRAVGRGRDADAVIHGPRSSAPAERDFDRLVEELCGNCASGSLYVAATGDVYFCAFSREISIGQLPAESLPEVVAKSKFTIFHSQLQEALGKKRSEAGGITACQPDGSCPPGSKCNPTGCAPGCNPTINKVEASAA